MNSNAVSQHAASAIAITNRFRGSTNVGQQWPTAIERRKRDARLARFADQTVADVVLRSVWQAVWTGPAFPDTAESNPTIAGSPPTQCGNLTPALPGKRSPCRRGKGCHTGHFPQVTDCHRIEWIVRVHSDSYQPSQLLLSTQHPRPPHKIRDTQPHVV